MTARLIPLALVALMATGCGGDELRKLPVAQARGKVLYKGKPPVGAVVLLVPAKDASPDAIKPRGVVGADGVFELATYPSADGKADGAPPGEYRVSLRWTTRRKSATDDDEGGPPGPPGGVQPDRLGERYSDPAASGLTLTVDKTGAVTPEVIELK